MSLLLARTNTAAAKHRGLTMFMVPLDSPGVEIRPIHALGGQRTNATYYADVRVPDACRIGDVDGGWGVMSGSRSSTSGAWDSRQPGRPGRSAPPSGAARRDGPAARW